MTRTIPLIRAMSLVPAVRWLSAQGRSPEASLREAGLPVAPLENPLRPVPLLHVARLLKALSDFGGPDVCCRIVASASALELALLGQVALGTQTPAEALQRISAALPLFCSHEQLSMKRDAGMVILRHAYTVRFTGEVEHLLFQYAAAMVVRLCGFSGAAAPPLAAIRLPPHPEHGIAHLERWLGPSVSSLPGHALEIAVREDVADHPFLATARDRSMQMQLTDFSSLRGDGSLAGSVVIALISMLDDGSPTLEDLARASGMSVRTFQRRLKEEKTSFSTLLDQVQRARARSQLADRRMSISAVAADLGYSRQGAFTRAVRRWSGASPKSVRRSGWPK